MIRNSRQLKDKINNLTNGDSKRSQIYLRNFFMERFLERVAESNYKNQFILKGGLLVASFVGLNMRATMDIDSTLKNTNLTEKDATHIIEEIIDINLNDGIGFKIISTSQIMEEHDYSGIRFSLDGYFEKIRQPIKVDLSTGDIITPKAIEYSYLLMFEERKIALLTYNIETLMAEKLETIIARGTANTRMRDFYDICVLKNMKNYSSKILTEAIIKTAEKRGTLKNLSDYKNILFEVQNSDIMQKFWGNFRKQSYFVGEMTWENAIHSCIELANEIMDKSHHF